ncbi:hypothetical protein FHX74_001482 [Friedmanniella endophytica]|uniref:Uncharacterized protein n=1 Tax=Microlunatus kandeliicorticis TaxID=1759536 RepID=A0A7W3IRG2_9ACTN|nr:hypothetical protein [Microlunatus kandeliicorticis]MBA8793877.1 hypothetical protein [Microlunatus kandeliicorticis]
MSQLTAGRAANAMTAALEERWEQVRGDDPDTRLHPSLLRLAILINSVPYDQRVQTLGHVLTIFERHLFDEGPVGEALSSWNGGDPDEFLTELTDLAAETADELRRTHPERALAYANYLRALGADDLITRHLDGQPTDDAP